MARRAISITLDIDNVAWLKGRTGSRRECQRNGDQLVTAARQGARAGHARSVTGTIDIDASDPRLEEADAAVRAAFDTSLRRAVAVRESTATYQARPGKTRKPRA